MSEVRLGEQDPLPADRARLPERRSLFRRQVTPGMALLVVLSLLVFRVWVVETVIVDGPSMEPTLANNDRVLVLKVLSPKRFEVVVLKDPKTGDSVIKRVVGMPGDVVSLKPVPMRWRNKEVPVGGRLYVNGVPYEEPYATCYVPTDIKETQVPEDCYYVLGDNRDDSYDSRDYGPVHRKAVVGVAVAVMLPLNRAHAIRAEAHPIESETVTASLAP